MATSRSFEDIAASIATMNKSEVKRRILNFKGGVKLDFTDSYLEKMSLDKLRHILCAAMFTRRKV